MKKCIYCTTEIPNESVIDFCHPCGISVWGEKMFKAIIENMESAQEEGHLYQGSVTDSEQKPKEQPQLEAPTPQESQPPQTEPQLQPSPQEHFQPIPSQSQEIIDNSQDPEQSATLSPEMEITDDNPDSKL
ncbi:hypothetical protein CMI47_17515 [Candidatus Pacearchaeota archaeon]|nr:hypothetical protein [Candidatus Pacearchaeota archaeon]|tara:strand:- start:6683 stop:7075 length:393 start_codon:yes stop_codon:yes gene_type:complete